VFFFTPPPPPPPLATTTQQGLHQPLPLCLMPLQQAHQTLSDGAQTDAQQMPKQGVLAP
jgi:hypothetical protein